jgi:hypothetical protein
MPWVSRSRTHFHTSSSILNSQLRVPQGGKSETSILHVLHVLHRTSLVLHPYFTVLHPYFTVLHRTSPYFTVRHYTSVNILKYEWSTIEVRVNVREVSLFPLARTSPYFSRTSAVLPRTSTVLQPYFNRTSLYFSRTSTVLRCTSVILQILFEVDEVSLFLPWSSLMGNVVIMYNESKLESAKS